MTEDGAASIALIERPLDAILFRNAGGAIDAALFLRDVHAQAAALPEAGYAVNACTDRYWFAVGFAACLLRGQVSLLTNAMSDRGLRALAARYGDITLLSQDGREGSPLRQHVLRAAATAPGRAPAVPQVPADRLAAIVFTSGSTGEPVGTEKCFGELAVRSRAAGAVFGFAEARPATIVGTVPAHHMYGFETTILLPLHAAAASWCELVFYPADLPVPLAAAASPRVLVTTPLQLRAMLQAPPMGGQAPELVISATAPLDAGLAAEAEQLWGCQVKEIFGASEVGSIASRRTVADAAWTLYPGIRLVGEAGPTVTAAGAPQRRLSDVVEGLPDGRFRLVGRSGDLVKLAGRRTSLAGLTRILTDIPGVSDGIFFAPDDLDSRLTARLAAFVVAPGLSDAALMESLRGAIDPVFLPRPLVRLRKLPRDALGKLPRQALAALLAQPECAEGVP